MNRCMHDTTACIDKSHTLCGPTELSIVLTLIRV